jgi:hypothetical protein
MRTPVCIPIVLLPSKVGWGCVIEEQDTCSGVSKKKQGALPKESASPVWFELDK